MIILPLFPHISLLTSLFLPFILYAVWRWGHTRVRLHDPAQRCRALWLLNLLPFISLLVVGIDPHSRSVSWAGWLNAIQVGIGPLQSPRLHQFLMESMPPPGPPPNIARDLLPPPFLMYLPLLLLVVVRQAGLVYGLLMGLMEWAQAAWSLHKLPRRREGRITVLQVPGYCAFTFGLLRPRIYVSEAVWYGEHRDAVCAHEQAHVRRRDPLLRFGAMWVRRVLWYLPAWRKLTTQMEFEAERACDAYACACVGRAAYARALLAFTTLPVSPSLPARAAAFPSAADTLEGETGLLARARWLAEMDTEKSREAATTRLFWSGYALFFLLATLLG